MDGRRAALASMALAEPPPKITYRLVPYSTLVSSLRACGFWAFATASLSFLVYFFACRTCGLASFKASPSETRPQGLQASVAAKPLRPRGARGLRRTGKPR